VFARGRLQIAPTGCFKYLVFVNIIVGTIHKLFETGGNNMLIVDRIELNFAICEDENQNMININLEEFIEIPKDGDVIELIDNKYIVNKEETEKRKNSIEQEFYNLFQ